VSENEISGKQDKEQRRAEKQRARAAKEMKAGARTPDKSVTERKPAEPARSAAGTSLERTSDKTRARKSSGGRRSGGRRSKWLRGRAKAARRRWKYTRRAVRRFYNRRYRFTYRSRITRVPSRDELPALLNARGLVGRGAEIGVKTGKYSDELLGNWKGAELVSIDPWLEADPEDYVDRSNVPQDQHEQHYRETRERLAPYGDRSTIWRLTSVEAATKVEDQSFDFVYIDARHDYASVLEDLAAWCAKVRPGGIFAGHDYVDGDIPEGDFGVKSAVDEFFGARGIPVHGTEGPSAVESFPTWIVEVPEGGISAPAPGTERRSPDPLSSAR
jgi:hypothetical protein